MAGYGSTGFMSGGRGRSYGRVQGGGRGFGRVGGGGGGSAPGPALLTSLIKKASTLKDLFDTCSKHESRFNHIHLSACWNMLGHLARDAGKSWFQEHATTFMSLVQHTTKIVSTSKEVRPRELANIAHGVVKSGRGGDVDVLMEALGREITGRVGDCNAQELANTAWAFAKAGQLDAQLFAALAKAAVRSLDDFNAQEIANTVWAFAKADQVDAKLFAALARVAEQHINGFNAQGLANTAWAFAKAGHLDAPLFTIMSKIAQQRVSDFNAQDLSHTAWAFAKLGQFDGELFAALARSVDRHLGHFSAQGLANTVWAFAKAGQMDEELFAALAKSIAQHVDEFNSQDLANTAWGFAKACHLDAPLFAALARAAERCLDDFNTQDLGNTAWAFAKVGQYDAALFRTMAQFIAKQRLDDWSAQQIASIAWAFAKAAQKDRPLFAALARSAEQRVSDFTAHDLANIAWAFANAGQLDASLFASLARAAEQYVDDFNDEELDNTEWAFASAGQHKIVKAVRQRRKRTAGAAAVLAAQDVDVSKCGQIVVAGGGIGGAAVAVALQSRGFKVVVLETDNSLDARKQGYGLTIQGHAATQAMGIDLEPDNAPSTSHYTFSAEGHILGFYGEAFSSKSKDRKEIENSGRFVHIPRQQLRLRLVEQIRPGSILWNSKLKSYSCWSDEDGHNKNGVTCRLHNGTTLDAALLVGSDGIFSTVRHQMNLPGDRLNFCGLIVVLGIVPTPNGLLRSESCTSGDGEEAMAVPLTQRRIFETVDGTTRIYAMPFTTDSTMWQLSFPFAEEAAMVLMKDPAALKAEIMQRCGEWHQPIPALLSRTPLDCMSGYPVYDRETLEPDMLRPPPTAARTPTSGAQPKRERRVTLIGDAAHPMTPFRAQGANQALQDAVLLADCLVEGIRKYGPHTGLDAALPVFERKMLSRSARMVVRSREKAKELHSSLILQPARKVQREADVEMQKVIRALQAKGVGANSATDSRGLDAVVEAAIETTSCSNSAVVPDIQLSERVTKSTKKRSEAVDAPAGRQAKKPRKDEVQSVETRVPFWGWFGGEWRQCALLKTKTSGKLLVEWKDGTTAKLCAAYVQQCTKTPDGTPTTVTSERKEKQHQKQEHQHQKPKPKQGFVNALSILRARHE